MNKSRFSKERLTVRWSMIILLFLSPGSYLFGEVLSNPVQATTIVGTVTDENGETMPGVNVVIKNTSTGVITDEFGKYSINVTSANAVLVFSFVGYVSQERPVAGMKEINIVLPEDTHSLEEVVVIGYGTTTRRESIGAVTKVTGEDMNRMKSVSIDALLQGKGSGIQVSQTGGAPDAPVRVMIRGTSSVSAETEPLWVIDGLPIANPTAGIGGVGQGGFSTQNPLTSINPNDIESIEVLKDAAATAIYGSRGANGVILVTTKTGKKGQDKGTFQVNYIGGITRLTRTPSQIGFTTGNQWLSLVNEARANAGLNPMTNTDLMALSISSNLSKVGQTFTTDMISNTNWFDYALQNGYFNEANISATQGFSKGSLYLSGNYRKEEGVLKTNNFERAGVRTNLDYEPLTGLRVGIKANLGYTKNNRPLNGGAPSGNINAATGGFKAAATSALPIMPVYATNGDIFNWLSGQNLFATLNHDYFKDELETFRALGGVYADYSIPFVKGLSFRGELSADILQSNNIFYLNEFLRVPGTDYAGYNTFTSRNYNYNLVGTYKRLFADIHNVTLVLGTESQRFGNRNAYMFGEDIPGTNQDFGSPKVVSRYPSGGYGSERYIRSYFGRVNYMLMDKYMVGASFRRDGTSVFVPDKRWSNFMAFSGGWMISEEGFIKNNIQFIQMAKIRASFGQTGNQNIPDKTMLGTLDWPGYAGSKTYEVTSVASPMLTWETTNSFDVGLDYSLFKGRVSGALGYYHQKVKDMLFSVPTSATTGGFESNSIWVNVGDMLNQGFEFDIKAIAIERKNFSWTIGFNITTNNNKLLNIIDAMDTKGAGIISGYGRTVKGERIATYYMADYAGTDAQTGVPYIYEIDRDRYSKTGETVKTGNKIPATKNNMGNHKVAHEGKTGLPTYFGGLSNTFGYKGFDLLFDFTYQGGNYIYDATEEGASQIGAGNSTLRSDYFNNHWVKAGSESDYSRPMWNNRYNVNDKGETTATYNTDFTSTGLSRYLYKGDYIRLRTLQLAYNLPQDWTKKIYMQNLRVYISVNNLFTITQYKGWDPEITNVEGDAQTRNLQQGVASSTIPQLRIWSAGINLTF